MLDAHQLNVFLTAAETLNFTQTARHLHMSQPSVSQHIQSLEKNFSVKLFVRKGRHIELTDAGRTLLPLARDMVRLSITIQETMNSLKGDVYGHLMVGCSTTPGKYILPLILAQFHKEHSRVQVTCNVTGQQHSIEMLSEGRVNVALVTSQNRFTKNAEFFKFIEDPVVLIVPVNHPWAKAGGVEPHDLLKETFILREEGSGTLQAVRDALHSVDIELSDLTTLLTLGNSEAIALAVQEGLGVGFVSRLVVDYFTQDRSIAAVPIRNLDIVQEIYIGFQTRHPASAAQAAFRRFINTHDIQKMIEGREALPI
jgi:DNA-binding transcriptional LysR family regulator